LPPLTGYLIGGRQQAFRDGYGTGTLGQAELMFNQVLVASAGMRECHLPGVAAIEA
jgi:hypothetical protein